MKNKIFLLLMVLLALSMFLGGLDVQKVKADVTVVDKVFYSSTNDDSLYYSNILYLIAQLNPTGSSCGDNIWIGQHIGYSIMRGYVYFLETSTIPDGATILNASVSLYLKTDNSTADFNIIVQTGMPAHPEVPLVGGDYYFAYYSGIGGQFNTSSLAAGYNNITLTATGISWINTAGTTKFCLRSNKDINSTAPTGLEFVEFYEREYGVTKAPRLYVSYSTGGYSYMVHGPYYEDGSVAAVLVNLTLEIENSASESYSLDGAGGADTLNITSDQRGIAFTWNLTGSANITRTFYLTDDAFEEIWIYLPSSPYYLYTFAVTDLVGLTDAYLESILNVDGQNRIIERQSMSMISSMPFWLTFNKHYEIRIVSDEGTYSWGPFIPATTYEIPLTVRGIDFPKETLLTCKYVRIYGLRMFDTPTGNITIYYEDLLNMTNSVALTLYYRNGTLVSTTTLTSSAFSYTFLTIYNDTDYKITCTINHQRYGTYNWKQYFGRRYSSNPWECLTFLGTFSIDLSLLIGAFATICAGGCATVLNPEVGAFVACATATILCVMGWFPIPAILLIGAWCLMIIYALARAKQRVIYR